LAGTISAKAGIISAKAGIISAKAGIISAKAGTVSAKAGIISAKAGTVSAKAGTVSAKAGIVSDKSAVVSDKSGIVSMSSDIIAHCSLNPRRLFPRLDVEFPRDDFCGLCRHLAGKRGAMVMDFAAFRVDMAAEHPFMSLSETLLEFAGKFYDVYAFGVFRR
jgi:hypothetical protein